MFDKYRRRIEKQYPDSKWKCPACGSVISLEAVRVEIYCKYPLCSNCEVRLELISNERK